MVAVAWTLCLALTQAAALKLHHKRLPTLCTVITSEGVSAEPAKHAAEAIDYQLEPSLAQLTSLLVVAKTTLVDAFFNAYHCTATCIREQLDQLGSSIYEGVNLLSSYTELHKTYLLSGYAMTTLLLHGATPRTFVNIVGALVVASVLPLDQLAYLGSMLFGIGTVVMIVMYLYRLIKA
jgi:hypothetical protein